jgi:WD40 repeat protein
MIFDINRAKLERETSGGHTRPMNCIKFSKVQNSAYLLITGGTEGQVRLWVSFVALLAA